MKTEQNTPDDETSDQLPEGRNLVAEIVGIVVSMIAGAYLALQFEGEGLGYLVFIILASLAACVGWVRRNRPCSVTFIIWILMLIIGWPLCGFLTMLSR